MIHRELLLPLLVDFVVQTYPGKPLHEDTQVDSISYAMASCYYLLLNLLYKIMGLEENMERAFCTAKLNTKYCLLEYI